MSAESLQVAPAEQTGKVGLAASDRILPETRIVSAFIVPILLAAFVLLYFWPDNTDLHFAWTIKPRMTPLVMGAGYIAGAYTFILAIVGSRWHRVAFAFPAATVFTFCMLLATVLHWDRFNHAHVSFFAWLLAYTIAPFALLIAWLRNRSADPGTPEPDDVLVPKWVRWVLVVVFGMQMLTGLFLVVAPEVVAGIWPWTLSPLTGRVLGGWFLLPGVLSLIVLPEQRWSAMRYLIHSQVLSLGLMFIGIMRAWDDFDKSNPLTWSITLGSGIGALAAIALIVWMESKRRRLAVAR